MFSSLQNHPKTHPKKAKKTSAGLATAMRAALPLVEPSNVLESSDLERRWVLGRFGRGEKLKKSEGFCAFFFVFFLVCLCFFLFKEVTASFPFFLSLEFLALLGVRCSPSVEFCLELWEFLGVFGSFLDVFFCLFLGFLGVFRFFLFFVAFFLIFLFYGVSVVFFFGLVWFCKRF